MLVYKLVQNLTESDLDDWENLAREELGEKIHPGRKQGFFLAREALRLAFREEGIELEIPKIKLNHFHEIISAPQYTISLSHTPHAGAAILGKKGEYLSVGIDIENSDRVVKDPIFERISNQEDLPLRNLELWCLKEAAFKAIMNTQKFEKPVEFSDIAIQKNFWVHSPSKISGKWKLELANGNFLTLAWISN